MKTAIITLVISIALLAIYVVNIIQYDINCSQYLKRAADANTVELAIESLEKAITYLESNNKTTGFTSVIYKSPSEDIGFWYNNIKASYEELKAIPDSASLLVKTNSLMKLRETLLDSAEKSDVVTEPNGISRYPHNILYGIIIMFGSILFTISLIIILYRRLI